MDDIQVAGAVIVTLKELLKERDDKIDELFTVNTRLQKTNQDHINTINSLESDMEGVRATATGRANVIQSMEDRMDAQWQVILELKKDLAASQELVSEKVSQLNLLTMRLSAMEATRMNTALREDDTYILGCGGSACMMETCDMCREAFGNTDD